jgi:hypothetical protein
MRVAALPQEAISHSSRRTVTPLTSISIAINPLFVQTLTEAKNVAFVDRDSEMGRFIHHAGRLPLGEKPVDEIINFFKIK